MYLWYSCQRRTEPWSIASRASTLAISLLQQEVVLTATPLPHQKAILPEFYEGLIPVGVQKSS